MEPRRSTRIASGPSVPVATAPATKSSNLPKTGTKTSGEKQQQQQQAAKPASKTTNAKAKPATAPAPAEPQRVPYLNPLPTPPEHIRPAAQLFLWGTGSDGQFGTGPSEDELNTERRSPRQSRWFEEQVAAGTFGKASGAGVEAIAAGGLHSMFIDEIGLVWTCGNNDEAALGRKTAGVEDGKKRGQVVPEEELTTYPHPIQSLIDEGFRAVRIAAGDSISGAISAKGELRVWGSFRANEGLLGFSSDTQHQALPSAILTLPQKPGDAEKAVAVAAGTNHLLVLTTHGNLYTWGAGDSAQLGRRVMERRKIHGTVPEKVIFGTRARKAVAIAAGSYHSFAIDTEGDVWGWGANHLGQTGTGRQGRADDEVRLPKKVKGLSAEELGGGERVVEIAGGEHHSLFLTSRGRVFACGRAYNGQLGLPANDPAMANRLDKDSLAEPALVRFPGDGNDPLVHVAAGSHNSMAVSEGGALFAWGQGMSGELGAKDEDEVRTPKEIVRRTGGSWKALQVACGGQHTLGLFLRKS